MGNKQGKGSPKPNGDQKNKFFATQSKTDSKSNDHGNNAASTPTNNVTRVVFKQFQKKVHRSQKYRKLQQKMQKQRSKRKLDKFAWNENNTRLLCLGYLRRHSIDLETSLLATNHKHNDKNNNDNNRNSSIESIDSKRSLNLDDIGSILLQFVGFIDKLIINNELIKYPFYASFTPFVINSIDKNDFNSIENASNYYDASNFSFLYILGGCLANQTLMTQLNCNVNCNFASKMENERILNENSIEFSTNRIILLSFLIRNNRKLRNNNLKNMNLTNGKDAISFFMNNRNNNSSEKIIFVIYSNENGSKCDENNGNKNCLEFNIYSITKDSWIFDENKQIADFGNKFDGNARILLFDQSFVTCLVWIFSFVAISLFFDWF